MRGFPRGGELLVTSRFEYVWSTLAAVGIVSLAVMWAMASS